MTQLVSVVKVGGSLFDLPDLGERLRHWLAGDAIPAGHRILLVPGGGPTTDVIRALDRRHGLGDEKAHWLALRALTLNAHVLADLLTGVAVVGDPERIAEGGERVCLLDAHAFACLDERRHGRRLPHTWDVTSDSVAARVAIVTGATALVLLKSMALPAGVSWDEAGRLGLVDPLFATVLQGAVGLEVRVENWRNA
jgi:aspartokinase-like uncharacterized kinase